MRRRPGISAGHSRISWAAKHMDVNFEPKPLAPLPERIRIHHPAIKAPEYKCYRVIRLYEMDGIVGIEDIGAFKEPAHALQMIGVELGRARVLNPNSRLYADNLQPMERR